MGNPSVIPPQERYGRLKELVFDYVDQVARIRSSNPTVAQQQPSLFFLFLCFPWLADESLFTSEQKSLIERRKGELSQLGFGGEHAKKQLKEVLANDKHLAECCPTPLHLANFLDTFFITAAADAKRQGATKEWLEYAFDEFAMTTYHQGRFKRVALSHLFNFEMDGNSMTLAGDPVTLGDVRVERLDWNTIPGILGESGFQAFLHPVGVGNCFVVEEEGPSNVDDITWLSRKRQKALFLGQILQYFQDGVVHIGYSVPVFMPFWANQLRRVGLFFLGNPRRESYEDARKFYFLADTAKDRLGHWWKAATTPRITAALANTRGKLRQAIYRAGDYYESSHERLRPVERLVALSVAVESLFSPSGQTELRYRISQSGAQFIGSEPAERQEVFDALMDMYSRRSKLVHGSYNVEKYEQGTFVTADEVEKWAGYVRRALLGFLTLYFEGPQDATRDVVLDRIAAANFDEARGNELRAQASIEKLFETIATNSGKK